MSDHRDDSYDLNCIETEAFRSHQEDLAGVLRDRSSKMDRKQQALLWMVLNQGASYGQVARLSGEHASTVSRRFRAMVRRLRGRPPHTAAVSPDTLSALEKKILIESFLYGAGQKQIAAKLGVSRYRVRKALDRFRNSK